uniref:DUF202 domain-containing protein n=1 Tax=Calcidiscus leptoporus TaxID=127549 RepID=A0A7S0J3U3_9EUKA|mmetsp:Transcript_37971/g.88876  ORF Transcript_37971/g.88876 Transcript_37971/m.88876 type:complete len:125 (+) Transcript_37971:61-435(+)|eukprot:CAMPEP_0119360356 /NCGR_PEP_ID=MMETSP1334-20130426/7990_1 /TAXON_ID=127549 /ORGANISM="Calcidiscus leptoporus, Strain RCC1130" /LENGTH=124 /DNA_ID=CAMNT_0007375191 /DNA_START=49 /DNA_END=423 /DNA_ORIENTATION=-
MSSEPFIASTPGPLEPKLFFANERTLLHWLHTCLTLTSIGLVLTAASDSTSPIMLTAGVILSIVSVALMWYAYRVFLWRMDRISSRAGERADDPIGPLLISGALVAALTATAIVTLSSTYWNPA